jgi:glycosyltransferase involved in cell wall biosynthesis
MNFLAAKTAVCIVRHNYYPDPQNHVRRDAEALVSAGYDVTVVSLRRPGQAWRERVHGVHVYRMPVVHRRASVLRYFWEYGAFACLAFVAVSLLHLVKRFRVVEVDNMPDPLVFSGLVPKLTGARVLFYIFDNMPEMMMDSRKVGPGHPLVRLLLTAERTACCFADRVIVTQEMPRRLVAARGVPDARLSVVLNCADDTLYHADVKRQRTREQDSFQIVTHGALLERYGIQTLIEALPRVVEAVPGAEILVFGAGEDRPRLEQLTHQLRLEDRVHFRGFVPMDELVQTLAQADVGYVGMLQDLALPNKLMEYVALGVPVVLSRWRTFEYYFPDDTVTYFMTGDPGDLADKLIGIALCPGDARERAGRASALYRGYEWRVQRQRYLGIYVEEVRRGGGVPPRMPIRSEAPELRQIALAGHR